MISKIQLFWGVCIFLGWQFQACQSSSAADPASPKDDLPSLFEKLYRVESLAITIQADIQQIIDDKSEDENKYQSVSFQAYDNGTQISEGEINARPRGITRKQNCDFPPLMLKVKKRQRDSLDVGKSENVKLVTYCKDSIGYPEWVAKEYLAYKLYNALNEHSFRVKLADVTYVDTEGKYPSIQKKGFLIEPLEELADRLDCDIVAEDAAIKSVHKEKYKLLTLYQYMIGNSDWNFTKRHNVRLLQCDPQSGPIPVPYDFDYSGLVNADYAKPHPMLPIKNVTDRLFQWRGSVDEDFSETIKLFEDKKSDLLSICQKDNLLSSETIASIHTYMDEFYQTMAVEGAVKQEITKARR